MLANMINLKIKKLDPNAVIPKHAKLGDVGFDLAATSKQWDDDHGVLVFGTGLAFEIPEGYFGLVVPRSSNFKAGLVLSNSCGVIDSGFRGEVKFMFYPGPRPKKNFEIGDRIGQLIVLPYPHINVLEVTELSETERGSSGFGSTGK